MNPMFLGLGVVLLIVGVVLLAMGSKEKVKTSGKYKAMMGMGGFLLVAGLGLAVYGAMSGGGDEAESLEIGLEAAKEAIKATKNAASANQVVSDSLQKQAEIAAHIQAAQNAEIKAATNAAQNQIAKATEVATAAASSRSSKLTKNLELIQAAAEAHKSALQLKMQLDAQVAQTEAGAGL